MPDGKVPPHHAPGVGTFYDFLKRAWLADQAELKRRRMRLRAPSKKPRKKLKAGEKMAPKHPGVIKRLVDRALAGRTFERRPDKAHPGVVCPRFCGPIDRKGPHSRKPFGLKRRHVRAHRRQFFRSQGLQMPGKRDLPLKIVRGATPILTRSFWLGQPPGRVFLRPYSLRAKRLYQPKRLAPLFTPGQRFPARQRDGGGGFGRGKKTLPRLAF